MLTTLAYAGAGPFLPQEASTFAQRTDWLFWFIFWVSVFFFVIIGGSMFWFAYKYRQRDRNVVARGANHNNALEVTWSIIPLIIVLFIFLWGFQGMLDETTPPGNAYEITVNAQQWQWSFSYPEGAQSTVLHLPANRPVRLVLESKDVIHSFYVPDFRTKKDVVPGRTNKLWVHPLWDANRAGAVTVKENGQKKTFKNALVHDLYCAEYCGKGHSQMRTKVVVQKMGAFRKWLKSASSPNNPVAAGKMLRSIHGCNSCHTVDGTQNTGPTWKDMYGSQVTVNVNGKPQTITADENYIRDSILHPAHMIVQGFPNRMPKKNLKPGEINDVIAYMKSVSKHYKGSLEALKKSKAGGGKKSKPSGKKSSDKESGGQKPSEKTSPSQAGGGKKPSQQATPAGAAQNPPPKN